MSTASHSPRRLTRKGQETRQRIVSAAADLIFERGVAHTTIEDVRAAADVSSSQLYHYFVDKAALVNAVIEHQTDAIVSNHERLDLSTLEGLRAWRDWVVDYQRSIDYRGGCPIGSLGSELADTDPEARAQVAEGFKRWETAIQSGLREMRAHGRLAPDADPDSLALALLTALQGGLLLAKIERNTKPLEAALDSILELVARLGDAATREDIRRTAVASRGASHAVGIVAQRERVAEKSPAPGPALKSTRACWHRGRQSRMARLAGRRRRQALRGSHRSPAGLEIRAKRGRAAAPLECSC